MVSAGTKKVRRQPGHLMKKLKDSLFMVELREEF